jgi:hypothetical protein
VRRVSASLAAPILKRPLSGNALSSMSVLMGAKRLVG